MVVLCKDNLGAHGVDVVDSSGLGLLEFHGEFRDRRSEPCNGDTVQCCCCCEVGNGVNCALLEFWVFVGDGVGGAVALPSCVDVLLTPFGVPFGHERFEVGPRFVRRGLTAPIAEVVQNILVLKTRLYAVARICSCK